MWSTTVAGQSHLTHIGWRFKYARLNVLHHVVQYRLSWILFANGLADDLECSAGLAFLFTCAILKYLFSHDMELLIVDWRQHPVSYMYPPLVVLPCVLFPEASSVLLYLSRDCMELFARVWTRSELRSSRCRSHRSLL